MTVQVLQELRRHQDQQTDIRQKSRKEQEEWWTEMLVRAMRELHLEEGLGRKGV